MTGINQKGRYGRYIQLILTCVDFLILNAAFFITASISPEFIAVWTRTVWLLANLAYLPAAYLMGHTQTTRTIAMEHVLSNSLKAVLLHAPLFICGLYFIQVDTIPWYVFCEFYGLLLVMLPLWWLTSRLIIKAFRRRGRNFSRVVIVGDNPSAHHLYEVMLSDVGYCTG